MVLNDLGQLRPVPHIINPPRQLRVPNKRVPSDRHVIFNSIIHKEIRGLPVVGSLLGVDLVPLHAVLGRQLAKGRLDDVGVLRVGEEVSVGAGAEVELALFFHEAVGAGDGLAGFELEEGHGEGAGGEEEGGELHLGDVRGKST